MSANPPEGEVPPSTGLFQAMVVAPVFNHARTLAGVLDRIARLNLALVVINDGSTDNTAVVADEWVRGHPSVATTVLTHPTNRGKAAALRTGFAWAARQGFTHAVTIDTDGQLDPEEIPDLLGVARTNPHCLVLGSRREDTAGLPLTNLTGWRTSGLGLRLETQLTIPDSQCGLRVYPIVLTEKVHVRARRFGFEAEVIARAAWSGFGICEVPVTCHYPENPRKSSHFRPWLDGGQGFFMHARLTLRRLNPWPTKRIVQQEVETAAPPVLRRAVLRDQLNPATLWRDLWRSRLDQLFLAAACGIGTFLAALPIGGWQFAAAIYTGLRFRMHFFPLLAGAALAYLETGRYIQGLGLAIGHRVLRFGPPSLPCWPMTAEVPHSLFWDRAVGGVIVGFFMNWLTIGLLVVIFRQVPIRGFQPEKR